MPAVSIETNIPGSVKSMEYTRNCHWLRLKDKDGNETKLIEQGLMRYWCVSCQHVWYSASNEANSCPCCQATRISKQWMRPQVALVPEEESDFRLHNEKTLDDEDTQP